MSKATHNGTCQACGNEQAVKANGNIAKHGYTVDYGYFEGTCLGSDRKPLEVERAFADVVHADVTIQMNTIQAKITTPSSEMDFTKARQETKNNENHVVFLVGFLKRLAQTIETRNGQDLIERAEKVEMERISEYGFPTPASAWKRSDELKADGWNVRYDRRGAKITATRKV